MHYEAHHAALICEKTSQSVVLEGYQSGETHACCSPTSGRESIAFLWEMGLGHEAVRESRTGGTRFSRLAAVALGQHVCLF